VTLVHGLYNDEEIKNVFRYLHKSKHLSMHTFNIKYSDINLKHTNANIKKNCFITFLSKTVTFKVGVENSSKLNKRNVHTLN